MADFHEVQELLVKDNPNGEQEFKIISEGEELVSGSLSKVVHYINNNELFDISANGNIGKYLGNWRYATEIEVSICIKEAKYLYAFNESDV